MVGLLEPGAHAPGYALTPPPGALEDEILERLTGDDPELHEMIAEETVNAQVARMVYEARTAAGLTQKPVPTAPGGGASA